MPAFIPVRYDACNRNNTDLVFDMDIKNCYQSGMRMLRILREKREMSQAALAKKAHTSQAQIARLEMGKREMTVEWAFRLAPLVETTPGALLFENLTVPVVGCIEAGSAAKFYDSSGDLARARMPAHGSKMTVAVEITGDSLGAALDGWIIYYDDRRDPPTDDLIGRLCVIGLANGHAVVKILMRGRESGKFDLFPNTGGTPLTDQSVAWAARVIGLIPQSLAIVEGEPPSPPAEKPKKKKAKKRR